MGRRKFLKKEKKKRKKKKKKKKKTSTKTKAASEKIPKQLKRKLKVFVDKHSCFGNCDCH